MASQKSTILPVVLCGLSILAFAGCSKQQIPGEVQDEAKIAGRTAESLAGSADDYLHDMDGGYRSASDPSVRLGPAEIRGRNNWIIWTAGNDRFWDYMANNTFGVFDLLKTLSSEPSIGFCAEANGRKIVDAKYSDTDEKACMQLGKRWIPVNRDNRWHYLGLVNEPCFEKATGPDPARFSLWLDKRRSDCPPDPFEDEKKYPGVKYKARGSTVPVGSYYGWASGIVGLRVFPNPDFDEAAKAKWDPVRYYTDPSYYNDRTLVRPYRVGMSCGFCHVGPSPTNPPADPEHPQWANLNSNPGAQYFWIDRIFVWNPRNVEANFIFQLLHTSLPGTLDTSFVSTDSINNPRTMNAVYNVAARIKFAKHWAEILAGGNRDNKQFNDYPQTQALSEYFVKGPPGGSDAVYTPRVLKDGSDSVGVLGALNRVFINIGLFSEEWLLHFNALVGGKRITPIPIATLEKNSVYWQATELQTPDLALFFLKSAQPDKLKDAPNGTSYLTHDQEKLTRGKIAFAENCARCHSSKQPPNLCMLGQPCKASDIIENSGEYFRWMTAEVQKDDFLTNNELSTDRRVPMTEMGINACSPLATNAIRNDIWDNFSSDTYKDLPPVGPITVYNPYTGEPWQFDPPGGGRGYVRPASLVSVWSTAPYLQNNAVGPFSEEPSVEARMKVFDESIHQMLWPDTRAKDSRIGAKIPGPSFIQRTTARSYIKVPVDYLPDFLGDMGEGYVWLHKILPFIFTAEGDVQIGPIPKGTPVALLSNLQLLSESARPEDDVAHKAKLLALLLKLKKDLKSLPANASDEEAEKVFGNALPDLLKLSKCPDYIINKGHYFGTNLSDDDKNALIEFLKTF